MRKNNANISSIRRAIGQERKFPLVQCTQYKRQMKMILIYQGLENTSYQVKKQRYNENQTALPVFQEETRTDLVQAQQQNSQVTSPLSSMLSKSSFKDSYEKILERYSSQFLTEAPQGSLEWMYATGGIVSLR